MVQESTWTWLITGCSRGIGLELVRQLIKDPENIVIATCRNLSTADALRSLETSTTGRLHTVQLDVTDEASIASAVKEAEKILDGKGLDYLYNNAGIQYPPDTGFSISAPILRACFESNVISPALVAQAFLPTLEKGKRKVIVNMTTGLSSFALEHGPKNASYTISKTGLNMLVYKQAHIRPDIISFAVDPGWLKTDMGGEDAPEELDTSVAELLQFVRSVNLEHSGKVFDRHGTQLPW